MSYFSSYNSTIDDILKEDKLKLGVANRHLWENSDVLYLYRIYLNKNQNFGVLEVGFNCGKPCGNNFRILVSKENESWLISKVIYL